MTGMEHAIEQVARVLIAHPSIPNHKDAIRDVCPSCPDAPQVADWTVQTGHVQWVTTRTHNSEGN